MQHKIQNAQISTLFGLPPLLIKVQSFNYSPICYNKFLFSLSFSIFWKRYKPLSKYLHHVRVITTKSGNGRWLRDAQTFDPKILQQPATSILETLFRFESGEKDIPVQLSPVHQIAKHYG